MKKLLIVLLFFIYAGQQIQARAVNPGESLWAMQRLVTQASCDVTIRQTDFSGGVYTISNSGVYCLAEPITGKIQINANNVVLDLNGKTMTSSSDNCVEVNGTSNALIKNGSVIAASNNGIAVLSGSNQVTIKNVTSYGSAVGINATSSTNVYVDSCDLIASDTGMMFDTVSRGQVNNTTASDSMYIGFLLDASSKNLLKSCHALNTGQALADLTADIYGFFSTDGSSNIFCECVAQNTLALTVTGVTNVTAGFALTGTESNSEISKCTSSIIQTSENGFAIPYGIQLQYSFDTLTTITGGNQGSAGRGVSWSPGGEYLIVGGNTQVANDEVQLFSFDRETGTLILTDTQPQGTICYAVAWSPDGAYVATGGDTGGADDIQIFSLNRAIGTLTKTDGQVSGTGLSLGVAWSPNGAYLAVAAGSALNPNVKVFSFNSSSGTLTKTDEQQQGFEAVNVAWSPDGAYLATVGDPEGSDEIQIFLLNRVTGTLTKTDGKNQGAKGNTVAWSPDGAYLATGGSGGDPEIQIFSFDRSSGTLTKTDGQSQGDACLAVSWSPDGTYLATGGTQEAGDEIQIFYFNRSTEQLTKVDGANQGSQCYNVDWAPDGAYLATAGSPQNLNEFQVFKALIFPSRNSIINNTVKSASRSSSLAAGVGISGSSIENLIIGNSSYNNGGFNYQFVTNVFDERFTTVPTVVQNISIKLSPLFYSPSP